MALVRFGDNRYDYFNKNNYILFSADDTHNYLFDYVASDLSCLSKLLEQYISKKINITTFELKNNSNSIENIYKIKEILVSAHPYYRHEYKKTIIKAIGNYFNELLLYSVYTQNTLCRDCTLAQEWYYQRFRALIPSSLVRASDYSDGLLPLDFYHKYKILIDDVGYNECEVDETFILDIPSKMPVGFYRELRFQQNIRNMIYFLLDISAQNMSNLTISQRIWIYSNIFKRQTDLSDMCVNRKLLFLPTLRLENNIQTEDASTFNNDNLEDNINDMFRPFYNLKSLDAANNSIPKNMMDTIIEYAKTIDKNPIYEDYEISNIQELLTLEVLSMIRSESVIKKCENCGKYFVPKTKKNKYCSETCYKVSKKKKFQQKRENDPALKLYDTAYKTHYARYRNEIISSKKFTTWQYEAKTKLDLVRAGELDISSFQEWLRK